MSLMNREPELGKNFWLALSLSMLVILGYPAFMKWISPAAPSPSKELRTTGLDEEIVSQMPRGEERLKENIEALAQTEGIIENAQPPETFQLETEYYGITFSTLGGAVTRLWYKGDALSGAHTENLFYEGESIKPGLFSAGFSNGGEELHKRIFVAEKTPDNPNAIRFVYEKPGSFRMIKQFTAEPGHPVIALDITLENISSLEKHFPLELDYGLAVDPDDAMSNQHDEAIVFTDKIESANKGKLLKKDFTVAKEIKWAGVIKKYFSVIVKPEQKIVSQTANADKDALHASVVTEPVSVRPGETRTVRFFIYAGPQRYETLKSFGQGFEDILSKGFFGMFKIWLLLSLKFLNQFTHNFGFAIILLTLIIKGIFAPLTHISYKSMKKMQAIQPKIKALQERHKKDPEKMNREMMELFRRNRVNPMAGCLPMLIQMPVLFAMFRLLPEAIELKNAPFIWWMQDLAAPDQLMMLPFTIPLVGWDALNVLPILMIVSQFWYQKLMPQAGASPEQAKIMMFMPVFFGFICYNMPSGLVLYWFVQNLLSIIQQVFINRIVVVLHHDDKE